MIFTKEKLYGPFLWKGLRCLNTTESIRGDSLLFTSESPRVVHIQTWSHPTVLNRGPPGLEIQFPKH